MLFWSAFSRIRTEYSVRMRENAEQNNFEYEHFPHSFIEKIRSSQDFL